MKHTMGLYGEYFNEIKDGKKKVEIRLDDEKRRRIKVGDTIEFIKVPVQDETFLVKVVGIETYATFRELYEHVPFKNIGCEGWTMEEMLSATYEIYTIDQEKKWGAMAIKIQYG